MPVMKISWISSPIALAFAQKFLPEQTWVPFFNIVAFVIGTYINTHTKKKRLAALRKKVGSFLHCQCDPANNSLALWRRTKSFHGSGVLASWTQSLQNPIASKPSAGVLLWIEAHRRASLADTYLLRWIWPYFQLLFACKSAKTLESEQCCVSMSSPFLYICSVMPMNFCCTSSLSFEYVLFAYLLIEIRIRGRLKSAKMV